MHACMHVCVYVCIYVCVCVYVCMYCMYVCLYMYMHTYTTCDAQVGIGHGPLEVCALCCCPGDMPSYVKDGF